MYNKINCKDCNASYVEQILKILNACIKEHENHINWNMTSIGTHSVTAHRLDFPHKFDWENINFLNEEDFLHERLTSGMIFISLNK